MRGRGPLWCLSLALALQACGGGNGGAAPPGGPAASATPPAGSAPGQTPTAPGPSEAVPPESAPVRATLSCADIFPAELPPAVEFTAEVLAHHSRCGPGLTDGQANYVALAAFGDVIGSRLYRFVPIEGGEASPNLVGGLYPESTVFGALIPQAHGYLWKWDGSGMSAPHLGPIPMYDEQGALLGVAQTLGKADTVAALPAGGSVATTVEYTNQPDATRQMLWRVERLDEAGRRLATYDDGWEPYDRYPPIGLTVNLAGHVLVSRYPHLRWLDGDLKPLTDWFPAPDYGIRTRLADGSVAFRRFGPGAAPAWSRGSWSILPDGATTFAPAPAWLEGRDDYDEVSLIRHGQAYAVVLGQRNYGEPYPGLVEVLTAAGESCGTFTLPASPCARYSVAQDGTVFASWSSVQDEESCTHTVDPLSCTWRWWPGLLR